MNTARGRKGTRRRRKWARADIRVVDPEEDRLRVTPNREVRDERIVGVQHERRRRGKPGQRVADLLRERVELEVPVHLVAEDVSEHQSGRPDLRQDLRERPLVDLEQADGLLICEQAAQQAGVSQQRGHQAGGLIRALVVEDRVQAGRAHHASEHAARGSLPVGSGHEHGPVRDLGGQAAEHATVDG